LTAKLVGLLIYIGCGTMALKRARSKAQRAVFLVAALGAFAYIVSAALARSPLGFFRLARVGGERRASCRRLGALVRQQLSQPRGVEDSDLSLMHGQQPFFLEPRECHG
jgi:hypothetical protein